MKPNQTHPSFFVRDVPVYGDAILAPMDGVSDWPFRSICRSLGSAMSYTEFVKADDIIDRPRYVKRKFKFEEAERPMVFQLYGDNPKTLLEAALFVQDLGPDIIDINMGCPAKSVAARGAGVGLMLTPLKIAKIFRSLSQQLTVPVTGKMRLGWDQCQTYALVARIVEENGGSLIALHGRTKQQGYSGQANWDAVAEIKSLVKIPVIASGDVRRVADIQKVKDHTGCDAVMIGRAAMGNPWIFSHLDREEVSMSQVKAVVLEHLEKMVAFYGDEDGQRLFRKHAIQYLMLQSLDREARKQILRARPTGEFLKLLDRMHVELAALQHIST